jgi:phosphoribosyl 1,2-cyclic phosphodiesterase
VTGGGIELLVDCGLTARQIDQRLTEVGGALQNIDAIVCTHGHRDHILGTEVLSRKRGIHLWATPLAARFFSRKVPIEQIHHLELDAQTQIGGLTIETVQTQHDIPGSVALILRDGEVSLGIATDLGRVTPSIVAALSSLDGLILEMNHDEAMLERGPYPKRLKQRILSDYGHLSNTQAAHLLDQVLHPGLQHLALAHLSEKNNTPELAHGLAAEVLRRHASQAELWVCAPDRPGMPRTLRRLPTLSSAAR